MRAPLTFLRVQPGLLLESWVPDRLQLRVALEENLGAVNVELTKDDVRTIEETSSRIVFRGDRYNAASQATIDR